MGHSYTKFTANIYTNLNKEDIAEQLAGKGTALGTAVKGVKRGKKGDLKIV